MNQNPSSPSPEQIRKLREALSDLQGEELPEKTQLALAEFESQLNQLAHSPTHTNTDAVNKEKAEFVSLVSHELRIPLTSIKGYTDIILTGMAGEINEQQREFLNVIANNVGRMSDLIGDLRDITQLQTDRKRLDIQAVSLSECASQAITNTQKLANEGDAHFEASFPADLPLVSADKARVIQVFTILLKNAVMYSSPDCTIRLKARSENGFVSALVEDEGFGISKEDRPRVFEPFYRSDSNQVREQQGWGLGLNIAWNIIQVMGGEIGIKKQTGQGTTFWFTLPAVQK
jgi:signal transduction histidine kinase